MQQSLLRPSPGVRASISADGLVLLDVTGGLVLASNAVGARIWQLLDEGEPPDAIATRFVTEYDVPPERAEQDVLAFVAALRSRGLVRLTEDER